MAQPAAKNARKKQDMNLVRLVEQFGSDDRCRAYLEALRWPNGVRCPKCESDKIARISTRKQLDCSSCRYRFSVTSGTVFHDSHLPLWKWFLAVYLMVESRKGMSANQLARTLAVSYKTAWYLCHRIRSAMKDVDPALLSETVEVDEMYIGGKRKHQRGTHYLANKSMVLGALQRGGDVRLQVGARPSAIVLRRFIQEVIADEAEAIYTDEHPGYRGIGDENTRHETVNHSAEEWVRGDVSTNGMESAWSLLTRSIIGSYHQLSAKHLPAYLDEFAFRFNGRENPFLFRDTLLKLVEGDALPYEELIAND